MLTQTNPECWSLQDEDRRKKRKPEKSIMGWRKRWTGTFLIGRKCWIRSIRNKKWWRKTGREDSKKFQGETGSKKEKHITKLRRCAKMLKNTGTKKVRHSNLNKVQSKITETIPHLNHLHLLINNLEFLYRLSKLKLNIVNKKNWVWRSIYHKWIRLR